MELTDVTEVVAAICSVPGEDDVSAVLTGYLEVTSDSDILGNCMNLNWKT